MVQQNFVANMSSTRRNVQSKQKEVMHKCAVWHSQHKSAGHIGEAMFRHHPLNNTVPEGSGLHGWDIFSCDQQTWDCVNNMCVHEQPFNAPFRVAMQGYTGVLVGSKEWGRPGDGKCVWATMSREPVSRLVSAFFYCQYGSGFDPLCGRTVLHAKNATIQEWAQHWGNFLFRELLLNTDMRQFAEKQPDFHPENYSCRHEAWLSWKYQLNGGDDPRTESGKSNLMELRKHMTGRASPLYDIHGVVEMWEETMTLFDEIMPMAGASWVHDASGIDDSHGSGAWKAEEVRVLQAARADPVILAELAADIELYNHVILPEFKKRVESFKQSTVLH